MAFIQHMSQGELLGMTIGITIVVVFLKLAKKIDARRKKKECDCVTDDHTFECPHCKQHLAVPKDNFGQTVLCPTCQGQITIAKPVQPLRVARIVSEEQPPHLPQNAPPPNMPQSATKSEPPRARYSATFLPAGIVALGVCHFFVNVRFVSSSAILNILVAFLIGAIAGGTALLPFEFIYSRKWPMPIRHVVAWILVVVVFIVALTTSPGNAKTDTPPANSIQQTQSATPYLQPVAKKSLAKKSESFADFDPTMPSEESEATAATPAARPKSAKDAAHDLLFPVTPEESETARATVATTPKPAPAADPFDIAFPATPAPKAEDAVALNNRGAAYYKGDGVPQDYSEAVKWFRQSADLGNDYAMCNLAVCYAGGNGVSKDSVEAVKWFRKAADLGNADAMSALGFGYANGVGVSRNDVLAYMWLNLATAKDRTFSSARDSVGNRLTPAQIAEAQKLATEYSAKLARQSGEKAAGE